MPELPEVETIRRELAPLLEGRRILAVRLHHDDIVLPPDEPDGFRSGLRGRRIEAVSRRGKNLLWSVEGGGAVQVQMRMSGRFALLPGGWPAPSELRHVAAEFDLEGDLTLHYDDVRRLGGFRRLSPQGRARLEQELGPEPLAPTFRAADLRRILDGRRAPIKTVLMDQRRLAGVGNIYASEALHAAGVDPARPAGSLTGAEVRRLHRQLRRVLREAICSSGTTFRSHRAVDGRPGTFQDRLRVYGREGEPCRKCGAAVRRLVQAGRSTFYCPSCQR